MIAIVTIWENEINFNFSHGATKVATGLGLGALGLVTGNQGLQNTGAGLVKLGLASKVAAHFFWNKLYLHNFKFINKQKFEYLLKTHYRKKIFKKSLVNGPAPQWVKIRKLVKFGETAQHCLSQRLKSTFYLNIYFSCSLGGKNKILFNFFWHHT